MVKQIYGLTFSEDCTSWHAVFLPCYFIPKRGVRTLIVNKSLSSAELAKEIMGKEDKERGNASKDDMDSYLQDYTIEKKI